MKLFVWWFAFLLSACTQSVESSERFAIRQPSAYLSLKLKSDGTAVFDRELEDASGSRSTFHSTGASWTECHSWRDRKPKGKPELEKTNCFIVEIVGTDEQGEARFGMNFVRDGNSLTQLMESGPTFVLKKVDTAKRPQDVPVFRD